VALLLGRKMKQFRQKSCSAGVLFARGGHKIFFRAVNFVRGGDHAKKGRNRTEDATTHTPHGATPPNARRITAKDPGHGRRRAEDRKEATL